MALLATHVKFALDIRQRFALDSVEEYCAGAAYPDSRYVTGVERKRTHFEDSPKDPFVDGLTDFERGWAAHNFYDMKAGPFYSELLLWPKEDLKQFNHVWCFLTGLKVVEDMETYQRYGADIRYLRAIGCVCRPMGEDAQKIDRYYRGLRELYEVEPSLERYGKQLEGWGASEDVCGQVIESVKKIIADVRLKNSVSSIYETVLGNIA